MTKSELVFIAPGAAGHIMSIEELAKILVERDERLSITVLIMELPSFQYSPNVDPSSRIKFIDLPKFGREPPDNLVEYANFLTENVKPRVKQVVSELVYQSQSSDDSPKLAGIVLDLTFTTIIDVANEFGVPFYIFCTSSAAFLGLLFYMLDIADEQEMNPTGFTRSDGELAVSCLVNPLPAKVLPTMVLNRDWLLDTLSMTRKFKEAKGIIINTFSELEQHTLNVLAADGRIPPVYAVGPILNLKRNDLDDNKEIVQWLDNQPPSSVVFLCFGSLGSLRADQLKEIAHALENTGCRFLWSLRRPPPKDKTEASTDSFCFQDVLPDRFLDRTLDIGRVIGWAPQVEVLAHPSIGGFVSHCGWNSTLESLWFGVPIAAWPLYSEQQLNAFKLVVELGLAVEIKMDYRSDQFNSIFEVITLPAEEIERGIRCLMKLPNEKSKLVKEMSQNSKRALAKGGSSYIAIGRLIEDVLKFNQLC